MSPIPLVVWNVRRIARWRGCTRVLRDRFSVEKITEFLKIADNMSCEPFRQACAEYIAEHVVEVRFRTHEVHFGTETDLYTYVKLRPYLFSAIVSNYVFSNFYSNFWLIVGNLLRGSFSAVSKPNSANKHSFESS